MGLGLKSFKDTFDFIIKNPKIFLLALIPAIPSLFVGFSFTNLDTDTFLTHPNLFYLLSVIMLCIIIFLLSVVVGGAFPILVQRYLNGIELEIVEALKLSLNKFGNILLTLLILIGISLLTVSIPLLLFIIAILFNNMILLVISFILSIPVIFFVALRLCLSVPITVLENKTSMESIMESWNMTKKQVWPILGGLLLLFLVVFVISFPITYLGTLLEILEVPYISNILNLIPPVVNLTFYSSFFTFVYFNVKKGSKQE